MVDNWLFGEFFMNTDMNNTDDNPKTVGYSSIVPYSNLYQSQPTMVQPMIIKEDGVKKRSFIETEQEELLLKRQKNTEAARRSRLKKLLKIEGLESKTIDLEKKNQTLTTRIAVLESENANIETKTMASEERIKILESQIREACSVLTLKKK